MENVTNRHFSKTAVSRPPNCILSDVLFIGCHEMGLRFCTKEQFLGLHTFIDIKKICNFV